METTEDRALRGQSGVTAPLPREQRARKTARRRKRLSWWVNEILTYLFVAGLL